MNIDHIFQELNIRGELVSVDLGMVVFNQGQPGDRLYVVKSGRLRVLQEDEEGQSETVGYLYAGDYFGEGALLTGKGHRATVRAAEDAEVLRIKPEDFQRALKNDPELRAYFEDQVAYIAYRNFTRFLKGGSGQVSAEAMQYLFGNLNRQAHQSGEAVVKRGDVGSGLYLIGGGELEAVGQDGETTVLKSGNFFGDQALIDGIVELCTVSVRTSCVLFRLDKSDFYKVIGLIPVLKLGLEAGRCVQKVEAEDNELQAESINGILENVHLLDQPPEIETHPPPRSLQFPFLKQHDQSDCGAACLGMVCKYYKMPIGLNRLRDMSNVSRSGTSMAALAEAAETLGFLTRGVRTGYEKLMHTELPAILHWKGNHFVVLFKTAKDQVRIADPAVGIRKLSRKEFEAEWTGVALLMEYTDQVAENEPSRTTFRRFFPYVKPYIRSLFEIFLASLVMSLFGLASPLFTQTIVDQVLVHHDRDLLNLMLAGMIVIALFQMIVSALRTYLVTYMSTRLSMTLLSRFYQHLLSLPMRFFALRKTGDLTTRFGENATIQALLTGTVVSLILDVIVLFVYLSLMIYYHLQLTLVVLAFIPLSIILTLVYTPILKSLSQRAFLARAEQSSVLIDSLRGIDTVKTLAIERSTRWRWEERYMKSIQIGFSGMKIGLLFGSAGGLMNLFSSTFILWYGATLVMDGELSVGQLMAFNSLIGNVTGPIMGLIGLWPQVQEARIALDRLNDVYETPMETSRQGAYGIVLSGVEGRIVFEKVFFRYGSGSDEPYVLSDISLTTEPGQKVAIVGRSGAGKTTLVKLIPRFFDPTEGRVTIDGIDVRDFDPGWLRQQVGMILQESVLFSGTIAENIALGQEDVDMDRVLEVARLACVHEFVGDMPLGYETKVGEQGMGLSGGQQQRIAIARALYHDPKILIFDEATNALDTESEQAIQENLEIILKDRTAYVIAHRLSTVQNADWIVVLDKGHVIEQGTHDELMGKQGLYHHLLGQQLQGV